MTAIKESTTLKQVGYSGFWKALKDTSFSIDIPDCITLRGWQEDCAFKLIDSGKPNKLVVAPTGSGKSIAINYLISHTLNRDINKKVIISVPQRAIGGGFVEYRKFALDKEGKEIFDFYVKHDYCSDNYSTDSKTDGVISFLENQNCVTNSDRILLCVNNTLVNVYDRLLSEDRLSLLDGIDIWFDEAHHIQTETVEVSNRLGQLVNHCLANSISINAVTATAFRGDRLSIIPRDHYDSFARYTLAYDEHFTKHCGGMGFVYDFVLHKEDWYDAFKQILSEEKYSDRKTIVFIPHPNTNAFKSADVCKAESVKKTLSIIKGKGITKKELIPDVNGVMTLNAGKNKIKVIDLVSEENRSVKVEYLRNKAGEEVDYVIGINVPKEGFDWPCANREFIIGPKSSLNELMQMMGRTFRGHSAYKGEEKDPVDIYHLLPWVDEEKVDPDELKIALNNYLKVVYLSMIGESIMNPPTDIKVPTRKSGEKEVEANEVSEVMEYVIGVLGETGWETFLSGCVDECRKVRTDNEDMSKKERNELIRGTILGMINANEKIECYEDDLCEIIFRSFVARSFNAMRNAQSFADGLNVDDVDFDILSEVDSMYFLLAYSNGFCNAETFNQLRVKMGERFIASAEQHREWITQGNHSIKSWRKNYRDYIALGAIAAPEQKYNVSWRWLKGLPESTATAEQHREWIMNDEYVNREKWQKYGYSKYKEDGAFFKPDQKFNVSWHWFTGIEKAEHADREQHRKWITEGSYTFKGWKKSYKKYLSLGAVNDPCKKFGVTWRWLRGLPEYADAEQHREWISENSYSAVKWRTEGFSRYRHLGATANPDKKFKKPWKWFKNKNDGSYKQYKQCPKKEKAREETIIKIYQKYFHDCLPSEKQYWSLCSDHTNDDGSFSYGSELGQLLRNNFIKSEQFYGVDVVESIITKNRAALSDANWLHGDLIDMIAKAHRENNFNPAIINADFVSMNKRASRYTSDMMAFLSYTKVRNVMVVVNVMYNNPYCRKEIKLSDVDVDELLKPYTNYNTFKYGWSKGGWNIHPMVYSYEGTGKKSNTIMSTIIFYRT